MEDFFSHDASEFNYGLEYLRRMAYWFFKADMSQDEKNAFAWYSSLNNLFLGLADEINDKELANLHQFRISINQNLNNRKIILGTIESNIYDLLFSYQIELAKLFKKYGFKTKYKDNPDHALR